jgi:CheY-like chemotaxis protein
MSVDSPATAQSSNDRRLPHWPLRIVVADDDHDTVNTLLAILRDEGHTAHGVYTGKDVLPALHAIKPDVIILDIAIPGISGYAVAEFVRQSFLPFRRPLMIAVSGVWTEMPDRAIARQVGFDHHLVKPCDPSEILRSLEPLRERSA